jgi:hypothetical protein
MGNGEGIVQTTNPHWRGGESRSGMKIRRPQGREGSIPSARTTPASQVGQDESSWHDSQCQPDGRSVPHYLVDLIVVITLIQTTVTPSRIE